MAFLESMTSLMEQIVGHREQKRNFLKSLKDRSMASSFILHGPEGVGKKKFVRALLQVANCQEEELSCGSCSPCIRSLQEKNELIYELNLQSKKNISMDQVRDLRQQLSLKSLHSARFVIVDPADCLSIAAANALLKLLEEAPEKTHFFLITSRLGSLITTIRSRCYKIPFTGLNREELLQIKDFSTIALDWSRGRVDQAFFLENAENREQLNESLKFFQSLFCEEPQDWKKKFPWFFSKDDERKFCLEIWNQALHKKLHGEGSGDDDLHWLPSDLKVINFTFEQLQFFEKNLWTNVDKLLALENFYYSLQK